LRDSDLSVAAPRSGSYNLTLSDPGDVHQNGDGDPSRSASPPAPSARAPWPQRPALAGASFGVDFNPTVDRLRMISDTGQNLRVNVDNGVTNVDTPLSSVGVTGAGYTNNDADPNTATTLFDLDSALDQASVQSPANSGMLAATGKLGVDTSPAIELDVYSAIRNGTTVNVRAFASLTVGGSASFYRINLLQGRASLVGAFSASNQVTGIAVKLDQG
jgi:hypothetical protein